MQVKSLPLLSINSSTQTSIIINKKEMKISFSFFAQTQKCSDLKASTITTKLSESDQLFLVALRFWPLQNCPNLCLLLKFGKRFSAFWAKWAKILLWKVDFQTRSYFFGCHQLCTLNKTCALKIHHTWLLLLTICIKFIMIPPI